MLVLMIAFVGTFRWAVALGMSPLRHPPEPRAVYVTLRVRTSSVYSDWNLEHLEQP